MTTKLAPRKPNAYDCARQFITIHKRYGRCSLHKFSLRKGADTAKSPSRMKRNHIRVLCGQELRPSVHAKPCTFNTRRARVHNSKSGSRRPSLAKRSSRQHANPSNTRDSKRNLEAGTRDCVESDPENYRFLPGWWTGA